MARRTGAAAAAELWLMLRPSATELCMREMRSNAKRRRVCIHYTVTHTASDGGVGVHIPILNQTQSTSAGLAGRIGRTQLHAESVGVFRTYSSRSLWCGSMAVGACHSKALRFSTHVWGALFCCARSVSRRRLQQCRQKSGGGGV